MARVPHRFRLPALAVAVLAGLGVLAATAPAQAATISYVALGDSYSSGDGAGNYSDGLCLQSANAYPVLWHNAHGGGFVNETCSGATTSDVVSSQLGGLSASTTLVTITIGGNDVGFATVMETCVLGTDTDCVNAISQAENQARTTLPAALDTVLSDVASRAPNAKVIVLGYPRFYDLAKSSTCVGLSTTKRRALNEGANVLDSVISAAASRHSDTYADVNPDFAGHQICDSSSYLIAVDWLDLFASYHPNASGQKKGYLPAVDSVTG
jgi:lysophospholipase L1-like esterase